MTDCYLSNAIDFIIKYGYLVLSKKTEIHRRYHPFTSHHHSCGSCIQNLANPQYNKAKGKAEGTELLESMSMVIHNGDNGMQVYSIRWQNVRNTKLKYENIYCNLWIFLGTTHISGTEPGCIEYGDGWLWCSDDRQRDTQKFCYVLNLQKTKFYLMQYFEFDFWTNQLMWNMVLCETFILPGGINWCYERIYRFPNVW